MSKIVIKQDRGPRIEFDGQAVAHTSFVTKRDDEIQIGVYETVGGAYIAYKTITLGTDGEVVRDAVVVEPPSWVIGSQEGRLAMQSDKPPMQREVMEFFNWEWRAKAMLEEAGWSFVRKVA